MAVSPFGFYAAILRKPELLDIWIRLNGNERSQTCLEMAERAENSAKNTQDDNLRAKFITISERWRDFAARH